MPTPHMPNLAISQSRPSSRGKTILSGRIDQSHRGRRISQRGRHSCDIVFAHVWSADHTRPNNGKNAPCWTDGRHSRGWITMYEIITAYLKIWLRRSTNQLDFSLRLKQIKFYDVNHMRRKSPKIRCPNCVNTTASQEGTETIPQRGGGGGEEEFVARL